MLLPDGRSGSPAGPGLLGRRPPGAAGTATIPRLCGNPWELLANGAGGDSGALMIRPGFLDPESRQDLIELTRDGSAAHRLSRRANALVLLDDGMSCEVIAKVCLLYTSPSP